VSFRNKEGKALDGLDVQALAERPNVAGLERRVIFAPKGNGVYASAVDFPEGGQWDVDFLASGDGTTYQMLRRFVIP
jgi:nitrogen fixation protein FixH